MRFFLKKWPPPFEEEGHSANQNTGFHSPDNKNKKTVAIFRWFRLTLKPPYRIAHDKLQLTIWDTSF